MKARSMLVATLSCLGLCSSGPAISDGYYGDRERGWFWFEDPPVEAPTEDAAPAAPAMRPTVDQDQQMIDRMEALQKQVKAARARAFFEPNEENVRAMATLQTAFVRRSSDVADVWQRTIWANPEFDFTLERPVNPLGLAAYEAENQQKRANTLDHLANTHVFYYFFRSDCPYCAAFGPVLSAFSIASGIEVFPVSLDGQGTADFPNAAADNGMAAALGVTTVPALFIADPVAGKIMPVGYGVMNEADLAQRIVAIADEDQPDNVRAATPIRQLSSLQERK
ncbi:MAG: conjugal transfer protein TraF [Azonexus sp.]|nr:conjugal transfer protein TraF [Azonexus sp.]